jgi:hypothetical protein
MTQVTCWIHSQNTLCHSSKKRRFRLPSLLQYFFPISISPVPLIFLLENQTVKSHTGWPPENRPGEGLVQSCYVPIPDSSCDRYGTSSCPCGQQKRWQLSFSNSSISAYKVMIKPVRGNIYSWIYDPLVKSLESLTASQWKIVIITFEAPVPMRPQAMAAGRVLTLIRRVGYVHRNDDSSPVAISVKSAVWCCRNKSRRSLIDWVAPFSEPLIANGRPISEQIFGVPFHAQGDPSLSIDWCWSDSHYSSLKQTDTSTRSSTKHLPRLSVIFRAGAIFTRCVTFPESTQPLLHSWKWHRETSNGAG